MIVLTKKRYTCNTCNKEGKHLLAIADNRQIESYFVEDKIEDYPVDLSGIYTFDVRRDSDGFPLGKFAHKIGCEYCNSKDITLIKEDNYSNVLNFYGPGEPQKWLEGWNKKL